MRLKFALDDGSYFSRSEWGAYLDIIATSELPKGVNSSNKTIPNEDAVNCTCRIPSSSLRRWAQTFPGEANPASCERTSHLTMERAWHPWLILEDCSNGPRSKKTLHALLYSLEFIEWSRLIWLENGWKRRALSEVWPLMRCGFGACVGSSFTKTVYTPSSTRFRHLRSGMNIQHLYSELDLIYKISSKRIPLYWQEWRNCDLWASQRQLPDTLQFRRHLIRRA